MIDDFDLEEDKEYPEELYPVLVLNRDGLTILIHPLSGNYLKDHTDYASWMGDPQVLKLNVFQ